MIRRVLSMLYLGKFIPLLLSFPLPKEAAEEERRDRERET